MPQIYKSKYLCVGCGACAYSCPKQCISYHNDVMGQYKPTVDYQKCIECKLCERRCPVYSNLEAKSDASPYNHITGNYIKCFKGFDERFRPTSASGGFLTAALYELLDKKVVEFVVCLRNKPDNDSFYQYEYVSDKGTLTNCSRSAYYPMEISAVLHHIKKHEGTYAMVVLPCQAKAIREIQKTDKILAKRIKYLLGLVCGGVPGNSMVEYVACDNNISLNNITSISFREKSIDDFNHQYSVTLRVTEHCTIKSKFPDEAFGFSYLNKLFHYRACNVCNDIFAEHADAVFMDAWLPEHNNDKFGTSICLIRNEELLTTLTPYFSSNLNCQEVGVDIAIEAQNCVGLIQRKKYQSYFKRRLYRWLGYITPNPQKVRLTPIQNLKFLIRSLQELLVQNKSEKLWSRFKQGEITFDNYKNSMQKFVKSLKRI